MQWQGSTRFASAFTPSTASTASAAFEDTDVHVGQILLKIDNTLASAGVATVVRLEGY